MLDSAVGDAGRPASRAGMEAELGSAQATVVSIASLAPLTLNHGYSVPIAGIWLQQSLLNSVCPWDLELFGDP